jgi:membrane-associated protein
MGISDLFYNFIDIILHLENYLGPIVAQYGAWTYLLLFIVLFLETGFVLTPFLPGDSLIFATGTMAGSGYFNIWILFAVLVSASIIGDTCNYFIGEIIGKRLLKKKKLIKKEHVHRTQMFFKKHGSKTIILARFVPIVRTFAPFMAGIAKMDYLKFLAYNVIGGFLWVGTFLFSGYYFGKIQFVQEHFSLVVLCIVLVSFIPVFLFMYQDYIYNKKLKARLRKMKKSKQS